jgi:hypothetical protein
MKSVTRRMRYEPRQGRESKKIRSISAVICEDFFAFSDAVAGHVSCAAAAFHSETAS